ncbi:hypothetical protein RvY_03126-2 [Ramazzottius varieornatus]|uniref:Uncharacterized protein n=1 Tax=Ramazzottius varieornatus TaxID=947166 RepID=A0A1D1UMU4_RAMVA|nr:hypothetical protein RvY_03126-2 [Ramazzottius varieornatus]
MQNFATRPTPSVHNRSYQFNILVEANQTALCDTSLHAHKVLNYKDDYISCAVMPDNTNAVLPSNSAILSPSNSNTCSLLPQILVYMNNSQAEEISVTWYINGDFQC